MKFDVKPYQCNWHWQFHRAEASWLADISKWKPFGGPSKGEYLFQNRSRDWVWCIWHDGKIVAFCTSKVEDKKYYLRSAWVDPKYRRFGLWKKLMRTRLTHAKSMGYKKAFMETHYTNTPVVKGLLKMGWRTNFKKCGFRYFTFQINT
jgi:ribosomal protein S18 acetylase RimI-like enzyme